MLDRSGVRGVLWGLLLLQGGCIPIPRTTALRPAGTVQVRAADTGAPIAAARVLVRRFNLGPPPRRETHRHEGRTGEDGRATFQAETAREWVMPLMMHGVPQWAFDVCVDAPGFAGRAAAWHIDHGEPPAQPLPDLTIALQRGAASCESAAAWRDFMTQVVTGER